MPTTMAASRSKKWVTILFLILAIISFLVALILLFLF
jgi:hypothetical protein